MVLGETPGDHFSARQGEVGDEEGGFAVVVAVFEEGIEERPFIARGEGENTEFIEDEDFAGLEELEEIGLGSEGSFVITFDGFAIVELAEGFAEAGLG